MRRSRGKRYLILFTVNVTWKGYRCNQVYDTLKHNIRTTRASPSGLALAFFSSSGMSSFVRRKCERWLVVIWTSYLQGAYPRKETQTLFSKKKENEEQAREHLLSSEAVASHCYQRCPVRYIYTPRAIDCQTKKSKPRLFCHIVICYGSNKSSEVVVKNMNHLGFELYN